MKKIILIFLIGFYANSFAQDKHPFVSLLTEVKGKRTYFFAKNKGKRSYDVFLMIQTKDYRRSSNKPVIKRVQPGAKVLLTTIIKLNGAKGDYTPIFIVNEKHGVLQVPKNHNPLEDEIDKALHKKDTLKQVK